MSPIEYIKEGILEGNWETVCEGYERLTGEALRLPTKTKMTVDITCTLEEIVDLATQALYPETEEPKKTSKKKVLKKTTARIKKGKKTTVTKDGIDSSIQIGSGDITPISKKTDGGRLITNEPDADEIEKNKIKASRSKRNGVGIKRQVFKLSKIKCSECEKSFESNVVGGEFGQKCPTCLSDKKNMFS